MKMLDGNTAALNEYEAKQAEADPPWAVRVTEEMATMSYTPTPYRQDPREGLFIFAVGNAKPIAKVTSKSTAAFIVRACNAHEALVAVATKISEFYAGTDAPIGILASEALQIAKK